MKLARVLGFLLFALLVGCSQTSTTPPDTTAPVVAIVSPASNASVSGTTMVQVVATDNTSVSSVTLNIDGAAVGTLTSTPYAFNVNTAHYANGTHSLTATAKDPAGNIGASAPISIAINNAGGQTAPQVWILSPTDNATVSGVTTIQVGASTSTSTISDISVYVDGVLLQTLAQTPFNFSWNTQNVSNGTHVLSATAQDAAGNTGASAPATVNVSSGGGNQQATATIKNDLINPVEVSINSVDVGQVAASSSQTFPLSSSQTATISFTVIKITTNQGAPVGDDMAGYWTWQNPSGNQTFQVTNIIGGQWYFCPILSNETSFGMLMAVNYGLQAQNLTNAVVPANSSNVRLGYFHYYTNSNVQYWYDGSNYTGNSRVWNSLPTPVAQTGVVSLDINQVP